MRPSVVKVGYLPFQILYVTDKKWRKLEELDNAACGQTSGALATIWIRLFKNQVEQVTKEILLHELLHAVFYVNSLATTHLDDEFEETVVRAASPTLMAMFSDNPKLGRYLLTDA